MPRCTIKEIETAKAQVHFYYLRCVSPDQRRSFEFSEDISLCSVGYVDYAKQYLVDNAVFLDNAKNMAFFSFCTLLAESNNKTAISGFLQNLIAHESGEFVARPDEVRLHQSVRHLFEMRAGV